jgi:uncharacterized phage protein gp47/JayE
MASPDFSEYIDLTVNDLQPSDIYSLAREYALIALPEFNPRTGTVEDAMLQAMSYVSGVVTGAINRLPNSLIEGMLRVMGFYRLESTFASGAVIFSAIDNSGLTIPAGTQVGYTEITDDQSILHIFETTASVTIDAGDTQSASTQIKAITSGVKPVIADGTILTILSPIVKLIDAEFNGNLTQGKATETDAEFFSRARTYLGSLSRSLATASQTTDYILTNYSDTYRVATYDLTRVIKLEADSLGKVVGVGTLRSSFTNTGTGYHAISYGTTGRSIYTLPTASLPNMSSASTIRISNTNIASYEGIWAVSNDPGTSGTVTADAVYSGVATTILTTPTYSPEVEILDTLAFSSSNQIGAVTVFLSDSTGASLTAEEKGVVADDIRSRCVGGLTVYVTDVILAYISVSISIAVIEGYSSLDVRTAVDAFVTNYLSPLEYPFTTEIRKNQLIADVANVDGVDYVDSFTMTVNANSTELASIDGSGNAVFVYKGTLPVSSVTVSSI